MKQCILVILLFISSGSFSQQTEFGRSDNALIYSGTTIHQLKKIVDSLNIKFRVCELNRTYYAKPQARANYIHLESAEAKEAKEDMLAGISFDDFIAKYPRAKPDNNLLLVRFGYKDYDSSDVLQYHTMGLKGGEEHDISLKKDRLAENGNPGKGKWVFDYWKGSQYTKESISAYYLLEDFTVAAIPPSFAKLILYSDCMVDTSVNVFYDKAPKYGRAYLKKEDTQPLSAFMDYVHSSTQMPTWVATKFDEKKYAVYQEQLNNWEDQKYHRIDSLQKANNRFDSLLQAAVDDAKKNGGSYDEFEDYVSVYYSKKATLELKRNRRVVGGCSQDDSPRIHAFNIALLSAETINWEIFLRCHLNIMNDRFDRVAESSIARERRETYIKELEVLDINVIDLLLGISLRFENASENHYYGSIDRLGRALAESKDPDQVENKMLEMISARDLDDYNRLLIYYLFLNYNYYVKEETRSLANKKKLALAVKSLPAYLTIKGVK